MGKRKIKTLIRVAEKKSTFPEWRIGSRSFEFASPPTSAATILYGGLTICSYKV